MAKSEADETVDLRCPRCVAKSKNGLLARMIKRKLHLIVQSALISPSPELIADLVLHCDNCNIDVVFMIAVLPSAPA